MSLPAGPASPPPLQLLQWIGRPTDYLERTARRYGDPFTMRLGLHSPVTGVFFSSPEAFQQLFNTEPGLFDSGGANASSTFNLLFGTNSLILLDGERHQQQRRLLTPPFHGERMRSYGELIRTLAEQVTARWNLGTPFQARRSMQRISLGVILKAVFGLHDGTRYLRVCRLLGNLIDASASPLLFGLRLIFPQDAGPMSPMGQLKAQIDAIDELLYAEIRERRERPDPRADDILSLLMAARDEAGQGMGDVELRDELMTLLVAGHETTATAMAWALYWIHRLPQVRERLLAELDSLGSDPDPEAIARLPYLGAVCSETLRIYPVAMVAFARVPRRPVRILDREYPAGTFLIPNIYLAHRRPEAYPDPERFRPERFLERTFSPYEFVPFGGGSRRCIGVAFALYEMKLVLATVLSRVELRLADPRPRLPVRRGLTLAPPEDLHLIPTALRSGHRDLLPAC
ncbi:cytochrome P450 [Gloeobacter violaceus]|uniref:Cytochrome P450 n=1 Tax=Gloeobacter violaceus (strain ATCC 29082 / PCC 7421) TaxID=251221 RepID=Q7NCB5_GLOVI|nr:cytochrome P450 [Gloeobacter violaceus]BAC91005.1 cytochrome P450 [Gloeobacter violaceus PCC 7421]